MTYSLLIVIVFTDGHVYAKDTTIQVRSANDDREAEVADKVRQALAENADRKPMMMSASHTVIAGL